MGHNKVKYTSLYGPINQLTISLSLTETIIAIWSTTPNVKVTVGDLWRALTKMERHDVQREVKENFQKDCQAARNCRIPQNMDPVEFTKTQLKERYHAMLLHGQEDEAFAEYMVTRMEDIGLKVFYPPRDLRAGMIELAQRTDIIAERCKKVVAVISKSFCDSRMNVNDVNLSLDRYIRNRQRILLPVIYTRGKIDNMPANLESLWKLTYRPESTLVNFWDRLIQSFEDPKLSQGLTEELRRMDFPAP